jgi:HPt (histidine-containing phosphotransfer) domain-containing protein
VQTPSPPLDIQHLDVQTGRDLALQREVLTLFLDQAAQMIAGLRDATMAPARRADLAHRLKGSARAIGAFGVAEAAEAVEADVRAERGVSRSLGELQEAAAAALAAVRQQLAVLPGAR